MSRSNEYAGYWVANAVSSMTAVANEIVIRRIYFKTKKNEKKGKKRLSRERVV
jgi:hypothetical protein